MSNKHTEMIGLDRNYKPVHAGDTIQDASGTKYTITDRGTCKGADGQEVKFSEVCGPELVPTAGAVTLHKERAAAPASLRKLHVYDAPSFGTAGKKAKREPQTAQETAENAEPVRTARKKEEKPEKAAPAITRRVYRGRENKSGLVRISKLAQYVGYAGGRPTAVARDAGFEIFKDKNDNPCVKLQDREAVEELLASQSRPEEKVPTSDEILEKALKKQKEVVVPPCVVRLPEVEVKPLEAAPVISPEEAALMESLIQPVVMDLQPASDKALVAELRRRGWTVTCEKHITL